MRKIVLGLAVPALVLAGMTVGQPAQAATVQTVALWNMTEPAGSTVLVDSSGHGLNGSIGTSIALNGAYATFPTIVRGTGGTIDPQHLEVINSPQLNPGTSDFIVTVRLLIPSVAASFGNVMQKGQTGTPGGFWKIQLDGGAGRVLCDFVSPTGSGGVFSAQVVADNLWHTVTCERSATQVTTTVDGITTRKVGAVGDVSNTWPLSIGGKTMCAAVPSHDCDYFIGSISSVQVQTSTTAFGFTPVAPARLLDTRVGLGAPKAPVAPAGTVHLPVLGAGGVPTSGVSAVALNVTATGSTAAGYITTYPGGTTAPNASNLNFTAGATVANLVVVPVGADGTVSLFNGSVGTTDLVADVTGYYLAGALTTPGAFAPLAPARLLDTRAGLGAPMAPVAPSGTVHLAVLSHGGVPASGVSAVVLNVTATGPTAAGYITAYPGGTTRPTASNLNFAPGATVANVVVVPVGADGTVSLFNGSVGATDLVADVAGYFVAGASTTTGAFAALAPARLLDTRAGIGAPAGPVAPGGTVHLAVRGAGAVPATGVLAVVLNVTVTQSTAAGAVTAFAGGTSMPATANLDYSAGATVVNLVVVPVGADGTVSLFNSSSGTTQLIADVAGYFVQ